MQKKEIRHLEEKLNTSATGRLPKSKRLSLKPSPDGIIVSREKKELPAVSITLDGKEYRRSYQFDNLPPEAIVRANLGKFVEGVRAAVWLGLEEGRLSIEGSGELKNSIWDVEKICADFDGMDARGFFDTKGKRMAQNKAFRYAIRQFFKDEEFAKAVCMLAIYDYLTKGTG